tara:strand:- start:312 stop:1481 length:1170 start_codon:yes stop_codon:yes gene_type:complete
MEAIQQTFNGAVGFGNRVSATISRNGDLVGRMYLEYNPRQLISKVAGTGGATGDTTTAANLGNLIVKEAELEIGGQKIDKHYGHWMTCWNGLTDLNPTGAQTNPLPSETATGGTEPTSGCTLLQKLSYNHAGRDQVAASNTPLTGAPTKAFVPLQFWFCRNPGLALPLIALQYHEVKTYITFPAEADLYEAAKGAVTSALTDAILYADYIYLDTDERRRFAQVSHEYLIEQVQFESFASTDTTLALNFNHPVKELVFTGAPVAVAGITSPATAGWTGMSTPTALGDGTIQLKLNGHDRFSARDVTYFTRTQVWQHHTGYGSVGNQDSVGVYSFALKPEEHQPSGTCNFSRIDNAQLVLGAAATSGTNVYAVNYNVLRIMSGMGGLAYSN